MNGADVKRGDHGVNLTTGRTLKVTGQTDTGRLVMENGEKWERWNVRPESDLEREVRLEEEMNSDLIERYHLRGITPSDY